MHNKKATERERTVGSDTHTRLEGCWIRTEVRGEIPSDSFGTATQCPHKAKMNCPRNAAPRPTAAERRREESVALRGSCPTAARSDEQQRQRDARQLCVSPNHATPPGSPVWGWKSIFGLCHSSVGGCGKPGGCLTPCTHHPSFSHSHSSCFPLRMPCEEPLSKALHLLCASPSKSRGSKNTSQKITRACVRMINYNCKQIIKHTVVFSSSGEGRSRVTSFPSLTAGPEKGGTAKRTSLGRISTQRR